MVRRWRCSPSWPSCSGLPCGGGRAGVFPSGNSILGDQTPPLPQRTDAAPERPPPPPLAEDPQAQQPATEYPLPPEAADAKAKPLPPLERSDPVVRESLLKQMPGAPLSRFVNMQDYVRRFVVTVDNLPRENVPEPVERVPARAGPDDRRPQSGRGHHPLAAQFRALRAAGHVPGKHEPGDRGEPLFALLSADGPGIQVARASARPVPRPRDLRHRRSARDTGAAGTDRTQSSRGSCTPLPIRPCRTCRQGRRR